jgi:hypothetical protein
MVARDVLGEDGRARSMKVMMVMGSCRNQAAISNAARTSRLV